MVQPSQEMREYDSSVLVSSAHHRIDQMVKEANDCSLYGSVTVCIKFEDGFARSFEHIVKGNEK